MLTKTKKIFALIALTVGMIANASAQCLPAEGDQVLAVLDSLMAGFKAKPNSNLYNKEELNVYGFASNDVPTYSDEVIQYRLKQIQTTIPLDFNNYVKRYIDVYAMYKRDMTSRVLGLADYYFPKFEEILDRNGMPQEMKYLAVVESALNPNAVSRCGATGLWQFMYSTALNYNLTINSTVDERRDPEKSAQAACDYFRNSYNEFGDWLLVIASYNCGPGNVRSAIRRAGGVYNFWEIQQYLPGETRGYVPAFIAVAYVMNYAAEHNLYPVEPDINYMTQNVTVDRTVSFNQISKTIGIPVAQLERLNPSYKKGIIPADYRSQSLTLPVDYALAFEARRRTIYEAPYIEETEYISPVIATAIPAEIKPSVYIEPAPNPEELPIKGDYKKLVYKVQTGEDLNVVCTKFSCNKFVLMEWNNLINDMLDEGQEINVYVPKNSKW